MTVSTALRRLRATGAYPQVPNRWQAQLGILRMAHRVVFRSGTVGTSAEPIRRTRRARLLSWRAVRLPFLLRERAVAPLDLSGLRQPPERLVQHLLAAHHDGRQCVYDLEILRTFPGALEDLERRVAAVVDGTDPRAAWLRDLVVFEGYHEALLAQVRRALAGETLGDDHERDDPDIRFDAWLRWCARQAPTPLGTLREGVRP